MKAIVQNAYGPPSVLALEEIATPIVGDDDVLVRVRAAAIHAGDVFSMTGVPYLVRFSIGWPRPKGYVPGYDVAGVVEQVGRKVTSLRPGDEVFGGTNGGGTCAELMCVEARLVAQKPATLTFEQAAAVPTSALAALHGLRDAAKVKPGQRVLVNGASGGVGHFAVQIAKVFGAEVTGVCSTHNVEMVRSLGADHVVDYNREDFTRSAARYDLVFDNIGNCSFVEVRRVLTPDGIHLPNAGIAGIGFFITSALRSMFVRQQGRPYLSMPNHDDLLVLKQFIVEGKLWPVIDRTYPLEETPEAMRYLALGHASGKVVIVV